MCISLGLGTKIAEETTPITGSRLCICSWSLSLSPMQGSVNIQAISSFDWANFDYSDLEVLVPNPMQMDLLSLH